MTIITSGYGVNYARDQCYCLYLSNEKHVTVNFLRAWPQPTLSVAGNDPHVTSKPTHSEPSTNLRNHVKRWVGLVNHFNH
jgi:hypothetical protein